MVKTQNLNVMTTFLALLLLIPSLSWGDTHNSLNSKNLKDNYYLSCIWHYDEYNVELIYFVGNQYGQAVSMKVIPNTLLTETRHSWRENGLEELLDKGDGLELKNKKNFIISSNDEEIVFESGAKLNLDSMTFGTHGTYHCIHIGDDISKIKTFFCGNDVNFRIKKLNGNIFYSLATYGELFNWKNIFDRTQDTPFVMVDHDTDNTFRFDSVEPLSKKKKTSIYNYSTGEQFYDNEKISDCWITPF